MLTDAMMVCSESFSFVVFSSKHLSLYLFDVEAFQICKSFKHPRCLFYSSREASHHIHFIRSLLSMHTNFIRWIFQHCLCSVRYITAIDICSLLIYRLFLSHKPDKRPADRGVDTSFKAQTKLCSAHVYSLSFFLWRNDVNV